MTDIISQTALAGNKTKNKFSNPIIIIGVLFFVFGFVTWLGSVLIPYLKIVCELNDTDPYFVAFSFYISYAVMAIPSAWLLGKTGFKNGMALGLFIMAVGTLLFIPAAKLRLYGLFLTGLYVQGTGLAILQTASNPYVTILGPRESAARRISIMGVCNGIASSLSPLILGAAILSGADAIKSKLIGATVVEKNNLLSELASRIEMPYLIMMLGLIALSLLVKFSSLPEAHEEEDNAASSVSHTKRNIFQFPHLLIGVFTLFLYVGVEVIAGDTIINYGPFQGIPFSTAKYFFKRHANQYADWLHHWYYLYPEIYFPGKSVKIFGYNGNRFRIDCNLYVRLCFYSVYCVNGIGQFIDVAVHLAIGA
ncbi:MAG: MFS transporter [Bacteroidota bacterium]